MMKGGLGAFIHCNLVADLSWKRHGSHGAHVERFFIENPVLVVFGAIGLIAEGWREALEVRAANIENAIRILVCIWDPATLIDSSQMIHRDRQPILVHNG